MDHLVVLLYQALCYVNLQVHVQGIRKSLCSIPVGLVMWAARRSDDVCRTKSSRHSSLSSLKGFTLVVKGICRRTSLKSAWPTVDTRRRQHSFLLSGCTGDTQQKEGSSLCRQFPPLFLPQARELVKNVPLDPPPARNVPRELFEMRVLYYF